jgi:pseudaminic acid synthase
MKIGNRDVGLAHKPYVIAEMSGNHNQSLQRALEIVDAAAATRADAIKLQTYTADTITLDCDTADFIIDDPDSLWAGRRLYDLYKEAHTPWEWHEPIIARARSHGMDCFSSAFDDTSVEFLETLGVTAYKIASFECTDLPLIAKVASTGKPMIISTGMATIAEIDDAVRTARVNGCRDLAILKCTSTYPASPDNTNLRTIAHMREAFGCEVGLSDHTMGVGVSVAAVSFGATIFEKHFTLRRADGGVDSTFSLEPEEFGQLVVETERAWEGLGQITYGGSKAEEGSRAFRRSLYIAQDMKAGESFTSANMRIVRPGFGLDPKFYDILLGKRINRDAPRGTRVTWDIVM